MNSLPPNIWSRLENTFPFNLLVDAICLVLILWWLIRDYHDNP
jgi:hypothetical protein